MRRLSIILLTALFLMSCSMDANKDSSTIVLEPTCTEYGIRIDVIGGKTYSKLIDPKGHETTKTEISDGYKYKCRNCDVSWTEKTIHTHLMIDGECVRCSEKDSCTHILSDPSWIKHEGKDLYISKCSKCNSLIQVEAKVGNDGPAGGIIFYDCDADNNTGNADNLKSESCGWRYLEASKSFLVLNGTEPTIDSSLSNYEDLFNCKVDVPHRFVNDIENMPKDDNGNQVTDQAECYVQSGLFFDMFYRDEPGDANERVTSETAIGKGNSNTLTLVAKKGILGDHAFFKSEDELKSRYYPANLCYHLKSENNGVIFDDWFLPSSEELKALLTLYAKDYTLGKDEYVWSSTEHSEFNTYAAKISDAGTLSGIYERGRGKTVSAKLERGSRIIPIRAF